MENLTLGQISAAVLFLTAPGSSGGGFFIWRECGRICDFAVQFFGQNWFKSDCSFDCSKCVKVQSSG